MSDKKIVALINSSEDTINLLRHVFEEEGFATVGTHLDDIKSGRVDFIAFLTDRQPDAIVYDLVPPYEYTWNFLKLVMDSEAAKGRHFVLTTANKRAVKKVIGSNTTQELYELVEKPYDFQNVVNVVKKSLGIK